MVPQWNFGISEAVPKLKFWNSLRYFDLKNRSGRIRSRAAPVKNMTAGVLAGIPAGRVKCREEENLPHRGEMHILYPITGACREAVDAYGNSGTTGRIRAF
jgi:hypothetical protein